MSSASIEQIPKNPETEIAVLQFQVNSLNEKLDDLKGDLKDIRESVKDSADKTSDLIKDFQAENLKSHAEMAQKVSAIEKWRWMLIGAGILAGSFVYPVITDLISG